MKLLFICTHNRCRSILAEAVTRHIGAGLTEARSAGSAPSGKVHPLSLKYLTEAGIDTTNLISQSWDEFESFKPDVVITVCDSASKETCPLWIGQSIKIHWALEDPSQLKADDTKVADAFNKTIKILSKRIKALMNLELDVKDKLKLKYEFEKLENLK